MNHQSTSGSHRANMSFREACSLQESLTERELSLFQFKMKRIEQKNKDPEKRDPTKKVKKSKKERLTDRGQKKRMKRKEKQGPLAREKDVAGPSTAMDDSPERSSSPNASPSPQQSPTTSPDHFYSTSPDIPVTATDDEDDEQYDTSDEDEDVRYSLPPEYSPTSSTPASDNEFSFGSSDSSEEEIAPPTPKKTRGRRPSRPQALSEDDPDRPSSRDPSYPRDRHGWTRSRKKIHVHRFRGERPQGPTFQRPDDDEPVDYFLQFFPLELFKKIARYTNINGQGNLRWTTTSPEEIKAWFGIRIIQGVHSNFNLEDDWSTHPALRNNLVSRTMTRGRFNMLSQMICCTNPLKGPHKIKDRKKRREFYKNNPLYQLQLIWDTVLQRCLTNWNAAKQLALDEAMIKYKGSKAQVRRFFMPLKPTKMGLKVYAVCEASSGYLINMMIHSSSGQKMQSISMKMMEPFLGRYHQLFCDKLYTSAALAKELLENETYICGAVKRSSKGLPVEFSTDAEINPRLHKQMAQLGKAPRGTMYFRQQRQLTAVLWRDTKVVSLLSTCHQAYRDKVNDVLVRNVKEPGCKHSTKKDVPCPPHATDYTRYMGGVDRNDQMRAYHTCSRQSMRWWKKILYFLVDVARVNAWICSKEMRKNDSEPDNLKHRIFTVAIGTSLIAGFSEGTPSYQPLLPPVPAINGPKHRCIRMPSKHPKMCLECRRQRRKTEKGYTVVTRTGCISCNIHLCRERCFLQYHAAEGVTIH